MGEARNAYKESILELQKFTEKNTTLEMRLIDSGYPLLIQFVQDRQQTLFDEDEDGEPEGAMVVWCGIEPSVASTLKFQLDAAILRKLIKLSEKVGRYYYLQFREEYVAMQAEKEQQSGKEE